MKILLDSARDSFILVGTFVAVTLFFFNYIDLKTNGKLLEVMEKSPKYQIIFGTFLGLTPGCGGAIMVVPLFLSKKVSFGTLVATFIATMGDAAFVLLVDKPKIYLYVLIISAVTAVITGLIIDYFNIGKNLNIKKDNKKEREIDDYKKDNIKAKIFIEKIGPKIFLLLIFLGFPLGILDLMQTDFEKNIILKLLFSMGYLGSFFSIFYTIIDKKFTKKQCGKQCKSSIKNSLIHITKETTFVITWVFVAFYLYNLTIYFLGGEEILKNLLLNNGFLIVISAILIGLIPGCGPQILLATLYTTGVIPFSALIANAICNDGDALFPLLALNKKASFFVTIYNVIPALLVGGVCYFIFEI